MLRFRLSNYACGALALLVGVLFSAPLLAVYSWVYAHGFHWGELGWVRGLFALVMLDFIYYWHHRAEHASRWLWPVHAVHHQSPICDASVSTRVSALTAIATGIVALPLALAGVDPLTYALAYLLHTGLVGTLHTRLPRWLERVGLVFNTPYLHRGHHSSSPKARNRNFGGVFIVWDRLFGTFESRCEGAAFGLSAQRSPVNPIAANIAAWRFSPLFSQARGVRSRRAADASPSN